MVSMRKRRPIEFQEKSQPNHKIRLGKLTVKKSVFTMEDQVQLIYNTRLRSRGLTKDFQTRFSKALLNDIQRGNDEDVKRDNDSFNPDDSDEYLVEDDASDAEDDFVIKPNEIFHSDEDEDEMDEIHVEAHSQRSTNILYGKDGTKWNIDEPNAAVRLRHHNIMRFRAGPKDRNSVTSEVFRKFFLSNISYIILTETNRYAKENISKWNAENPNSKPRVWKDLTSSKLDAFIGILLASGVSHNNMQYLSLLSRSDALPIFRAAISYRRFLVLSRFFRFDDGRTREFRQKTDKAAPIGIYGIF